MNLGIIRNPVCICELLCIQYTVHHAVGLAHIRTCSTLTQL